MLDSPIHSGKFDTFYSGVKTLVFLIRYRPTIAMNLWVPKPSYDSSMISLDGLIKLKSDHAVIERMNRRLANARP